MKTPSETPALPWMPCCNLRTKKMYIPALADAMVMLEEDANDQSFYWCNKTLGALGRDDCSVHPRACQPGRCCHEE